MKRLLLSLMLLSVTSAVFWLAAPASALAGGTFSNRDLEGEYLFILTTTETSAPPPCSTFTPSTTEHAGTLSFDGMGVLTVTETRRCSDGITVHQITETNTLNYSVNPDGSFLVIDPVGPSGGPVHGQIMNHGRSLLIDGTTINNPNVIEFHGVAMQR